LQLPPLKQPPARKPVSEEIVSRESVPIRQQIMNLEEFMKAMPPEEIIDLPVAHHFSHGIPKGCVIVGKIHKHANLNIISKGDITVMTEDGPRRVTAPCTIVSPPGVKRVGYAHEDTVWTCIHGTHLTDLDAIEDEFIAKSFEELETISAVTDTLEFEGVPV
jgi:hypothetical protein